MCFSPQWVPVDSTTLREQPALGRVPVDPPASTETASWKFDTGYSNTTHPLGLTGMSPQILVHGIYFLDLCPNKLMNRDFAHMVTLHNEPVCKGQKCRLAYQIEGFLAAR